MKKTLLLILVFLFMQTLLFANPYIARITKAELTGRYVDPEPTQPRDKSAPGSDEKNYEKTVPYRLWEVLVEWEGKGSWIEQDLIVYCNGSYQTNAHYYYYTRSWDWDDMRWIYTTYHRYYDWVQGGGTYTYTCEYGSNSKTVSP